MDNPGAKKSAPAASFLFANSEGRGYHSPSSAAHRARGRIERRDRKRHCSPSETGNPEVGGHREDRLSPVDVRPGSRGGAGGVKKVLDPRCRSPPLERRGWTQTDAGRQVGAAIAPETHERASRNVERRKTPRVSPTELRFALEIGWQPSRESRRVRMASNPSQDLAARFPSSARPSTGRRTTARRQLHPFQVGGNARRQEVSETAQPGVNPRRRAVVEAGVGRTSKCASRPLGGGYRLIR